MQSPQLLRNGYFVHTCAYEHGEIKVLKRESRHWIRTVSEPHKYFARHASKIIDELIERLLPFYQEGGAVKLMISNNEDDTALFGRLAVQSLRNTDNPTVPPFEYTIEGLVVAEITQENYEPNEGTIEFLIHL